MVIWNIPLYLGDERNPKFYVDISQKQIDQKGYEASEELREKKIPENLEPGNTFNYEVDWTALVGSKYDPYWLYNFILSYIWLKNTVITIYVYNIPHLLFYIVKSRGIRSVRLCLHSGFLQGKNTFLSKDMLFGS